MPDSTDDKVIGYAHDESALPPRRTWQRVDTLGLLAYIGSLLLVTVLLSRWADPAILGLAIALPIASFVRRHVRKREMGGGLDPDARFEASFRVVTWAFTFLVLAGTFRVFRCPHGDAYGIGPVGIAYRSVAPVQHPYRQIASMRVIGQWYVWARY